MEFHIRCTTCDAINRSDTTQKGKTISCVKCSDTVDLPNRIISPGLVLSDRYALLEQLGGGGFANVWKARQLSTDRVVAVKILKNSYHEKIVERFQKEVRLVAQLEHPLIVTAFDAGEDTGLHYFVMSYVPGQTLQDTVADNGPLAEQEALKVAAQVADAMQLAWGQFELVHRDIKPANLMLTPDNTVRLLDLGIARANLDQGLTLTPTNGMIGTVSTMSPEQIETPRQVTCQSDLYALGCTLYFLLTGRYPFHGPNQLAVLNQHLKDPPEDPRRHQSTVSEATAELVLKLLEKKPAARPKGWTGLRALLPGDLPSEPTIEVVPALQHRAEPASKLASRRDFHRWVWPLVLGGLALALALLLFLGDFGKSDDPEPFRAAGVLPKAAPGPASAGAAERRKLYPPRALTRNPGRVVMPDFSTMPVEDWPKQISYTVTDDKHRLVEIPMNLVPAGTFTMGRTTAEREELPDWPQLVSTQHEVTITRPFYLALSEFTLEQWSIVTQFPMPLPDRRHHPAFDLMWKDVAANEHWRAQNPGTPFDCNLQRCLHERYGHMLPTGYEWRLPTEAEWEYACRAGSTNVFPFGDNDADRDLREYAHFGDTDTMPVASLKPNAWGFFDMLGNSSEWVLDGYAPYPRDGAARTDPMFARDGSLPNGIELRMLRGGSFVSADALDCSPGYRLPIEYYKRETRIGFRMAVAPVIDPKRRR